MPPSPTIAENIEYILTLLGVENDEGTGGRGVLGRLARIEHKLGVYDRTRAQIAGAAAAGSMLIVALWYVLRDRIDHFLGRSA